MSGRVAQRLYPELAAGGPALRASLVVARGRDVARGARVERGQDVAVEPPRHVARDLEPAGAQRDPVAGELSRGPAHEAPPAPGAGPASDLEAVLLPEVERARLDLPPRERARRDRHPEL